MRQLIAQLPLPLISALAARLEGTDWRIVPAQTAQEALARAGEAKLLVLSSPLGEELRALPVAEAARVVLLAERPDPRLLDRLPALGAVCLELRTPTAADLAAVIAPALEPPADLARYLAGDAVIEQRRVYDSTSRGELLDELDRFFSARDVDARLISQLLTIADELITNSFYNAPIDALGRRSYALLSRIDTILSESPVEVSWGTDRRLAGVSVRDSHGTLEPTLLLRCLGRATGSPQPSFHGGGAGLGLATAYRAASQLTFELAPHRFTLATGLVSVAGGYRQFADLGKCCQIIHRLEPGA